MNLLKALTAPLAACKGSPRVLSPSGGKRRGSNPRASRIPSSPSSRRRGSDGSFGTLPSVGSGPRVSRVPSSPSSRRRCRSVEKFFSDGSLGTSPAVSCINNCGWTAHISRYKTCCKYCRGTDGPHTADCPLKNQRWVPPCRNGCDRTSFASFSTCCALCEGPEGPHSQDCGFRDAAGDNNVVAHSNAVLEAAASNTVASFAESTPKTCDELSEALRIQLAEWQRIGATKTRAELEETLGGFAKAAGMEQETVRMLWLTVARQARPIGAPAEVYVELAQKHHAVDVEVIDLGQYGAVSMNSCMFLVCAAAVADRRSLIGDDGDRSLPSGALGDALAAAAPGSNATDPVEELIAQHRRGRAGTLGRMADALRLATCEMLTAEADFFRPYYAYSEHGSRKGEDGLSPAYGKWVDSLRAHGEGDELVILALSRLLGMAVQPVQQSGYRVPLMDPTGAAASGYVSYWGNDDRHWVWLRPTGEATPPLRPIPTDTIVSPAPTGSSSTRSGAGDAAALAIWGTSPKSVSPAPTGSSSTQSGAGGDSTALVLWAGTSPAAAAAAALPPLPLHTIPPTTSTGSAQAQTGPAPLLSV